MKGINCLFCGAELHWQNDEDAESCGYEEAGTISFYDCPKCGGQYEIFMPAQKESANEQRTAETVAG